MVLLVDDDDDVREALAELIKLRGFPLLTATNGVEALSLLQKGTPCIILLDLVMPIMDGWQLLAKLRASPALREVPVVVISAHAASNPPTGVNRVLTKPIDLEDLYASLEEFCGPPP